MKLMMILSLFVLNITYAQIGVDDSKRIVLAGDDCNLLSFQAESILTWSHRIGENESVQLPECFTSASGKSIIDVYAISPKMVQKYQGVKPEYSGPNCWNRALAFAKILPSLSYSTAEEMTFWMDSPLCEERLLDEEAIPGDIIVVRKAYGPNPEVHGFTYISDDLTFSKNGYSNRSPYEYQSLTKVLRTYGVPEQCGRVYGKPEAPDECSRRSYANYFHCMSVEEYFTKSNIVVSEQNYGIYKKLIKIDAAVFSYLFNENKVIDKEHLKSIKAELQWGVEHAKAYLADESLDQENRFFWMALTRRAEALLVQITLIR